MSTADTPPPDPRRSPRLRWMTQEQADQAAQFIALPGAASFLTLVSAACLLAGLYGVLAPALGGDDGAGDGHAARFAAMGVVALYLGSLLGVVGIMCRWQAGNPDAIGASLVGCVLVVGQAVTLDLIAVDHPCLTAVLAVLGLGAVLWLSRTWNRLTRGPAVTGMRLPLTLLLGWNYLGPVAFGLRSGLELRHPGLPALHPAVLWLAGMLVLLSAGVLALRACRRDAPALRAQAPVPLLCGRGLRWLLVVVLLAASAVHHGVLGYGASLDLVGSDLALVAAVMVLIANELCAGRAGGHRLRDALALAAPALGVVLLSVSGASTLSGEMNRGPDAVQACLLLLHPVATLAALSILGLGLWWGSQRTGLLLGVVISSSLLALLIDAQPGSVNSSAGLAVATSWCLGSALWRHRPRLALAAVLLAEMLALTWSGARELLAEVGINDLAVVLVALGGTTLLVAAWHRGWVRPVWARWAAWLTCVGWYGCCLPVGSALHGPVTGTVVLAGLLAVVAWRARDRWLLGPLGLPGGGLLPQLMPDRACWLGIDVAFLLLGVALWVGRQRLRTMRPVDNPTGPPAADGAPAGGTA